MSELLSSKESIERCYNEFMPSGRCTLPCGHLGLCVSPDQAEIERLRAALEYWIDKWENGNGGERCYAYEKAKAALRPADETTVSQSTTGD